MHKMVLHILPTKPFEWKENHRQVAIYRPYFNRQSKKKVVTSLKLLFRVARSLQKMANWLY